MKKIIYLSTLSRYDVKIKKFVTDLIATANGDINTVKALVETLIGTDASKSARTIAAEEIAKQLIPENAAEALDTLQEIAAWIQAHPSDVAEINRRITALETYVGAPASGTPGEEGYKAATGLFKAVTDAQTAAQNYADIKIGDEKTRAELAEGTLSERLDDVEDALGEGGSVETKIATAKSEAIAAAAEDATTKTDGLKNTTVSSTSGEDIKATLGGTVGAPTISIECDWATNDDIDALFEPKTDGAE